jgi:glutathione S-transferase
MRKVLWLVGYLWAFPVTVLGLLPALLFARLESVDAEYILHFVVQPGTPLAWYVRRFNIAAFTLGAVVTYAREEGPRQVRLVRHERAHVMQTLALGPLFLPLYVLASLWELVRGNHPYLDNWFEVRARAAEVPGSRSLRLVR